MQKAELDKLEQHAKDVLEGDELQEVLSAIAELRAMPSLEEYRAQLTENYMAQIAPEIKPTPVFTGSGWRYAVRLLIAGMVFCRWLPC